MSAPRCSNTPCRNFGALPGALCRGQGASHPKCGQPLQGQCSGCHAGLPPVLASSANAPSSESEAEKAAVLATAAPNDPATCARKLALSLEVAQAFCDPALAAAPFVPFLAQKKVNGAQPHQELVFHVEGGLYIGAEAGAGDLGLLRGLGVSRVINATGGFGQEGTRRPNWGELLAVPGWDVAYTSLPLADKVGVPVGPISAAMARAHELLTQWAAEGRVVLVHCSAGLCRSAALVVAHLMQRHGLGFGEAMARFRALRGRPAMLNSSYVTALWRLERERAAAAAEAAGAAGGQGLAAPTYDFTPEVVEEMSVEAGERVSLLLAPAAEVAARLQEMQWEAFSLFNALMAEKYDGAPKPSAWAQA